MRKIRDIRVFEDESLLRFMRRASVAVAVAGLAVAVAWWVGMSALRDALDMPIAPFELGVMFGSPGNRILGVEGGQGFKIWWWVLLAIVPVASLALHELVHAFFFKQYAPPGARVTFGANAKMGMVYASAEGVVYTRQQYLVITIAPSIVVSLLLLVMGMGLRWPLWTIIVTTAHLMGCTGDWGYVRAILRDRGIAYCEDTSYGVALYGRDRAARPRPGRGDRDRASARARHRAGSMGAARGGGASHGDASRGRPAVHGGRARGSASPSNGKGFTVVEGGRRR